MANMTFKTNLLPGTNNAWELGSSSLGWKITKINIPTTSAQISSSTVYGPGSSGQVLKSNGTTVYWGEATTDSVTDVSFDSTTRKLQKTINGTTSDITTLAIVPGSGDYSAIGGEFGTSAPVASGASSFAYGNKTTASGNGAVTFGNNTTASGNSSMAIGGYTVASGSTSFAGGTQMSGTDYGTTAGGIASFAYGISVKAEGGASQSFGQRTIASANMSTAFGNYTIASGRASMSIGQYNIEDTDTTTYASYGANVRKYLFTIGNGTAENARSNAFTVDWDGNTEISGYLKTNKIQIPIASNGTTYGVGSAGQALLSNGSTVYWGNHTHSEIVTTGDNRSIETKPNDYSNKIIFQGIKTKATIGAPSNDSYSYVVGLRGWSDSSGGNSHELAFNNTGLQIRNGATTTWNAWRHITTADLAGVGASNNPVYVASDGKITASSYTIKTSVPENAVFTDAKVKQTAVTASDYSNWRSLICGAANNATEGFSPTTLTDQVYTTSSLSVQPSTGTIKATTFKGTATAASTVSITDTARTSATTYYPIFVDEKTGNQTLRASSRLYYYDYGVAASGGWLNVGTNNFKGGITLHDNSSYYGSMSPTTLTANRSYTLPDKSGTIALTSDLTTTVSNAWSDGVTAGPKISTTVNGVTSQAISIPSASSTKSGVVTTVAQTFAGDKSLTGITTLNNAFRVQRVEIIKSQETDQSAGWYRTCIVKQLHNYANFKVLLTGGWVNGAPTLATLDVHMRNGLASIVIEHRGFATGRITKVRLAKVEGTTNNAYFDVFLPATSGSSSQLYATFYGNFIISDIATENTITTSTTDIIASADIETYGYYNNAPGYFSKLTAGGGLVKAVSSNKCEISLDATASGGNHGVWSNGYYNGSTFQSSGKWVIYRGTDGEAHTGLKLYGAVFNDYAEMRNIPDAQKEKSYLKPGMCVREVGDGTMVITTTRLERGCKIISDTFGFNIGETDTCKTPIAVSGRVLAYIYEGREIAKTHIGWAVCSGPNGTVSIMTEEEEEKYPSRVVGIISEIPNYETWGSDNIKVDGRIWIYVK